MAHSASQTFALALLELFHLDLLFVTSCIFFSSSSRCDRLSACACTSQIRQEPPNWQEEELEILGVATVGKVHTFTDKLSKKMYPTACSGLKLARYSWVQSLLHSFILDQIFRRTQCTEMQHLWFHKKILWKPGTYFVAKMDSLGNLVLTIMKNSGKITSASFDTICRFSRFCKCSFFTEPVLCKVMTKPQNILFFLSSRDIGVPCTEQYQNQEVPVLTQLNFQSCLET